MIAVRSNGLAESLKVARRQNPAAPRLAFSLPFFKYPRPVDTSNPAPKVAAKLITQKHS